ncbi:ThiF family adenylyltransferase [Desulfovibrio mangrovi]|uniref:ThiF family adenylyltransferase n=1 Tax=Desulfovibrio mangrovi TaxID=2976983 RepID=UPI0022486AE7|nr:ThiF family adenylyltransferase [Desulfovibrio mangrovi]UZP68118.1 ThiF family adenylyltransferase [Desulfovibrio mangrovi]
MLHDFLHRARPIFTEEGLAALGRKTVAFAGLGGVGGGAFLALVRCGVSRFRLAENGMFDPPDMNRQAAAFGTTMGRSKLDVYVELARSINPDIRLELFPQGIVQDNLESFLDGADAYVGVIDVEKGAEVKAATPALLKKFNIPMFTCGAIGFGALLVAHEPEGMMPDEFWKLVTQKSGDGGVLPSYLSSFFDSAVMERIGEGFAAGILPTTAIGGLASNTLLACEVLAYLLQDDGPEVRKPVFAPRFTAVDFLGLQMVVGDVTRD